MKTKSSATRAIATMLAAGAVLAISTPDALAINWYSKRHPLIAHQKSDSHNPNLLAAGYGRFYNLRHTAARSVVNYKDLKPGNKRFVYGETKFLVYSPDYFCGSGQDGRSDTCWHEVASDQTGRSNAGAWEAWRSDEPLDGTSTKMRGRIHVCEDQSWMPDDCSPFVTLTLSY